ncbi:MAG: DUF1788 domain-containing protein [Clostridiales bacterium]|jgi:hypothetical protein|nr:DUF1788 domain-containing protein [Clostridiales bacterium]
MKTLNQRLDLIKPKILSPEFRSGRGLGNEINFWIFDYAPEDEMAVRAHAAYLRQSIAAERDDICIVMYDLFDLMVEALEGKGYLDRVLTMEKDKGSAAVLNPIRKTLRLTLDDDIIVNRICEGLNPDTDIVFILGVGKSYPIIRSHTVPNNLHSRIDRNPVVMFFPGVYESELRLFGEITDDNYYRAFRLIER